MRRVLLTGGSPVILKPETIARGEAWLHGDIRASVINSCFSGGPPRLLPPRASPQRNDDAPKPQHILRFRTQAQLHGNGLLPPSLRASLRQRLVFISD